MGNVTIEYTAQRRLKAGVIAGDPVTLTIDLAAFDKSPLTKKEVARAQSGITATSLYYIRDRYSCTTVALDPTEYPDMEQFLYSVAGGEQFTFTNMDEDDRVMNCKMEGDWSYSRPTTALLKVMVYSFSIEDIDL